jgi:hypothetical protein
MCLGMTAPTPEQCKLLIFHDQTSSRRSQMRHKSGKIKLLTRIRARISPVHKRLSAASRAAFLGANPEGRV